MKWLGHAERINLKNVWTGGQFNVTRDYGETPKSESKYRDGSITGSFKKAC